MGYLYSSQRLILSGCLLLSALGIFACSANAEVVIGFEDGSGIDVKYTDQSPGGTLNTLCSSQTVRAEGLRYDSITNKIWLSGSTNISTINTDGTGYTTVVSASGRVSDLVIDRYSATPRIMWYYYPGDYIRYAALDGTGVTGFITSPGAASWSIDIDSTNGYLYYLDRYYSPYIKKKLLSDTSVTNGDTVLTVGAGYGLVLDVANNKMYWSETAGTIKWSPLDVPAVNTFLTVSGIPRGLTIDYSDRKIYWVESNSDGTTGDLMRANLDGSPVAEALITNNTNLYKARHLILADIEIPTPTPTNTPTATVTATPTATATGTATWTSTAVPPTATSTATSTPLSPTSTPTIVPPTATSISTVTPTTIPTIIQGTATPTPAVIVDPSQIGGIIRDVNGRPVIGVLIDGGELGAVTTDENGRFTFSNATPGETYTFIPRFTGYQFEPASVQLVAMAGKTEPSIVAAVVDSSILECPTTDITEKLIRGVNHSQEIKNQNLRVLRRIQWFDQNRGVYKGQEKKLIERSRRSVRNLFLSIMQNNANLPELILHCPAARGCAVLDLRSTIKDYKRNAASLRTRYKQLVQELSSRSSRDTRLSRARLARVRATSNQLIQLLNTLPPQNQKCS